MSTSRDHLRTAIAALESQRAILGEAIARDTDTTPQVPNAIDGQARAPCFAATGALPSGSAIGFATKPATARPDTRARTSIC